VPASKTSSQKPPRSGQGSTANSQSSQPPDAVNKDVTDSSAAKQEADDDVDADRDSSTDDDEAEKPDSPMLSEPHEQIEMFDWGDLQQRYHDETKQLDSEEAGIMNEFHALCDASLLSPSSFTLLTSP
jgi:hypothetical protein